MKLKEDAVPTKFIHNQPPKRRLSSIQRENSSIKKQILEDAFSESPSHSNEQENDLSLQSKSEYNDVAVGTNPIKTKSIRTQYKASHFGGESNLKQNVVVKLPITLSRKTIVSTKDFSGNTDLSFDPRADVKMSVSEPPISSSQDREEGFVEIEDDWKDPDYNPIFDSSESEDDLIPSNSNSCPGINAVFLVFWSCLLPLLQRCSECSAVASVTKTFIKGTMLVVDLSCPNFHHTTWRSQPIVRGRAIGNLALSAGILFSGNTFQRIKELMEIANVSFFSHTTFNQIQKKILYPAVHRVYLTNRTIHLENAKEEPELHLLGDGRSDSPGYSAKYGTYTLMSSISNYILDFHVSHSKMAGNSARMEFDGLKEVLTRIEDSGLTVTSLTTDRHKQVRNI